MPPWTGARGTTVPRSSSRAAATRSSGMPTVLPSTTWTLARTPIPWPRTRPATRGSRPRGSATDGWCAAPGVSGSGSIRVLGVVVVVGVIVWVVAGVGYGSSIAGLYRSGNGPQSRWWLWFQVADTISYHVWVGALAVLAGALALAAVRERRR